jgi:hypothetical protein
MDAMVLFSTLIGRNSAWSFRTKMLTTAADVDKYILDAEVRMDGLRSHPSPLIKRQSGYLLQIGTEERSQFFDRN